MKVPATVSMQVTIIPINQASPITSNLVTGERSALLIRLLN
jgi:hypothetical protein